MNTPPEESSEPVGCSVRLWCTAIKLLDEIYPNRGMGEKNNAQVNELTQHLAAVERLYKALPKVPPNKSKRK